MRIAPPQPAPPVSLVLQAARPSRPFEAWLGDTPDTPQRAFGFSELGLTGVGGPTSGGPGLPTPPDNDMRAAPAVDTGTAALAEVQLAPRLPTRVAQTDDRHAVPANSQAAAISALSQTHPLVPAAAEDTPAALAAAGFRPGGRGPLAGPALVVIDRVGETTAQSSGAVLHSMTGLPVRARGAGRASPEAAPPSAGDRADPGAAFARRLETGAGAKVTVADREGSLDVIVGLAGLSGSEEDELHRITHALASEMGLSLGSVIVNGGLGRGPAASRLMEASWLPRR